MLRALFWVFIPVIANAQSAGFDCKEASNTVEKTICDDSYISSLDYLLNRYYKQALDISPNPQSIKDSQHKWLIEARNVCQNISCLKTEYNKQLHTLETVVLSRVVQNRNFTGVYESDRGEFLVDQFARNRFRFNSFVVGPYDENKAFSPNSCQIGGNATLVGDTAYYNDGDECSLIFVFTSSQVTIFQYDCWILTSDVSVAGKYNLKSKVIKGNPLN